jgi:hypothetical protein
VAWTVKLTSIDRLISTVLEGVVFTLKELALALKESVLALKESVLVLKEPVSVLESVLCMLEGVTFVFKTSVVWVRDVDRSDEEVVVARAVEVLVDMTVDKELD